MRTQLAMPDPHGHLAMCSLTTRIRSMSTSRGLQVGPGCAAACVAPTIRGRANRWVKLQCETAVQDARSTGQALSQRMLILKRILISICLYCPRVNCRFKAFSDTREVNLSLCVGQIFTSRCSRLCYGVDSGTSDYGLYAMILTEINPDLAVSQPA